MGSLYAVGSLASRQRFVRDPRPDQTAVKHKVPENHQEFAIEEARQLATRAPADANSPATWQPMNKASECGHPRPCR
jgi:hypothetical protein